MSTSKAFQWLALPDEMKRAVLSQLVIGDIWACARVDRNSYQLCLPSLFEVSFPRNSVTIVNLLTMFLADSEAQFPPIFGWLRRGSADRTLSTHPPSRHLFLPS